MIFNYLVVFFGIAHPQTLESWIIQSVTTVSYSWRGQTSLFHTVDGRNPAPPGMYKTMETMNIIKISTIIQLCTYQLVQDFWTINSSFIDIQAFVFMVYHMGCEDSSAHKPTQKKNTDFRRTLRHAGRLLRTFFLFGLILECQWYPSWWFFSTHLKNMCKPNWIISPRDRGEHKKMLKTTT